MIVNANRTLAAYVQCLSSDRYCSVIIRYWSMLIFSCDTFRKNNVNWSTIVFGFVIIMSMVWLRNCNRRNARAECRNDSWSPVNYKYSNVHWVIHLRVDEISNHRSWCRKLQNNTMPDEWEQSWYDDSVQYKSWLHNRNRLLVRNEQVSNRYE